MRQLTGGPGFQLEALESFGIRREPRGECLDRDISSQSRITSAVHLAHAAGPNQPEHVVRTELRPFYHATFAINCSVRGKPLTPSIVPNTDPGAPKATRGPAIARSDVTRAINQMKRRPMRRNHMLSLAEDSARRVEALEQRFYTAVLDEGSLRRFCDGSGRRFWTEVLDGGSPQRFWTEVLHERSQRRCDEPSSRTVVKNRRQEPSSRTDVENPREEPS